MLVDGALACAARGWPVFPCEPRGKRPLGELVPHGFHDATLDTGRIRAWWTRAPAANVAIVMGPPSGLFAVDVDPRHGGHITLESLERRHGKLPTTLRAHTGGGGEHILFRLPVGIEVRSGTHRLGSGLDIKAAGGYIVAAPSVHPDGGVYAWGNDEPPAEAPDWLVELAKAQAPQPIEAPTTQPRRADAMTRASAWLATLEPAISGQGGHQQTWKAAVGLVCGFDIDASSALYLLMREFNPRCDPPWSKRDLEHKVAGATRARLPRGYLLDDPKRAWAPPPWRSGPELVLEYQGPAAEPPEGWMDPEAPAEAAAPVDGPTTQEPLRGLPKLARVALLGRDIILAKAREPVAYVWQDIAVAGTIVLLAGGPSEGKTTLLFLLLVARANLGEPIEILNRKVLPAPPDQWVVIIEGEHGEVSTCRKLTKSCALLGVHDLALSRLIIVARKAVRIGSPEWSDVMHLVAAGLVSDIAIDTVARVAPGDANDEREQVAIFDVVAQTIECAPAGKAPTAWACAHTRKNGTGGLEDVAGSAQRTGQADSVLLVKGEKVGGKTVSSTVTFAKLREDPEEYPEPVKWAIVQRPDGSRGLVIDDVDTPEADQPIEARIEAALMSGPKTKTALAQMLNRSRADIDVGLSNLFNARRVITTTATHRGNTYKAFGLRSNAPMGQNANPDANPDEV